MVSAPLAPVSRQDAPPPSGKRGWWRWLVGLGGLLALFYVAVGWWGSGLLIGENPRWRGIRRGPRDLGLVGETVSFESTDAVPIKAWWLPAASAARGTVIVAPGVDHTREAMLPRAAFLVRAGYNVLAVDLRGHGESGGRFISPGLVEERDILGAIRYLRARGERGPVALLGVCLGGVASLYAAADSIEVGALVADSAFPSGIDVFRRFRDRFSSRRTGGQTGLVDGRGLVVRALFTAGYLPGIVHSIVLTYYLRTGVWLGFDMGSVLPAVSRVRCPVLVISGEADWIVPPVDARRILAAVPGRRKAFLSVPNAAHDGTFSSAPDLYQDAVLSFLEENLERLDGHGRRGTRVSMVRTTGANSGADTVSWSAPGPGRPQLVPRDDLTAVPADGLDLPGLVRHVPDGPLVLGRGGTAVLPRALPSVAQSVR